MELKRLHKEDAEAYRSSVWKPCSIAQQPLAPATRKNGNCRWRRRKSGLPTGAEYHRGIYNGGTARRERHSDPGTEAQASASSHYRRHVCPPGLQKNRRSRRLMEAAISQARELPFMEQVCLSVMAGNEAAKSLYLSLGFETYGVHSKSIKIGEEYGDEELMALNLASSWTHPDQNVITP